LHDHGQGLGVSEGWNTVWGVDGEWTVERHLAGKPAEIIALYHRFIELASAAGPFTYSVAKTAVVLKGSRRGYAGVGLGMRSLDGYLDLQRRVVDPRIRRSAPYTKKLFVNYFRVVALDELDEGFGSWLAEAHQVGDGVHLTPPSAS
jgi:hypothetical protein